MKKIIQAGRGFMNLDGEPIRKPPEQGETTGDVITIGEAIGNALMAEQGKGEDAVKLYLLSIELRKNKEITLDVADFDMLEKAIDKVQTSRLAKAQMKLALMEAETVGDKKGK